MAYPFSRLKTDGFWRRVPKPGYDQETEYNIKSMPRLREVYHGAKMDNELFRLMCDLSAREQLRAVLINTYFAEEIRPLLLEQGKVNYEAYEYSKKLLADPERGYGDEEQVKNQKARDQGFRKSIVILYEHRCAFAGYGC